MDWAVLGNLFNGGLIGTHWGVGIAKNILDYRYAMQQNRNQQDNARLMIQQSLFNSRMAEREAEEIDEQGRANTFRMRKAAEAAQSSVVSALGKSGAAITSGSPLAVLAEAAAREEMKIKDAQILQAQKAAAARTQAASYGYQAAIGQQNLKAIRASKPSKLSLVFGMASSTFDTIGFGKKIA
jgi:hypothetical protein